MKLINIENKGTINDVTKTMKKIVPVIIVGVIIQYMFITIQRSYKII